jgi:hypothetical protein
MNYFKCLEIEQQAEPVISKDAYDGAREDLAIWKIRALKAEELNRKFVASVNSQTYMGEPVQAEPVVTWGVDWGEDEDWVSIVKRHPDGTLEVVATEGRPVKQQAEPVAIPGAILMGQVAARSRSIPERAAAVGDAE